MSPASLIFLPILNLDPTDNTCLWSTLNYFVDYCERYRVIPFLTFDRQLWDKAFKMIQAAPHGHRVKTIRLILGLFHVELSFLGAVGTLMEGSGLQEALEQIIAKNSVPQVLSGKAQERAFRAHMLAATALNRIILKMVLYPTQEGDEDTTESEHRDDDFEDASEEVDELKPIPSPVSSSDDDSDHESFTEYIKRSQDVLTSSSEVPTSFDVTNAIASCATADSALSEMDSSSITMP